ncbi:hypothetical protein BJV74DRAFT_798996 [Russula compacta]|nr:hypothetical protein BJV74DRAFT_798996 [Russula compacta]
MSSNHIDELMDIWATYQQAQYDDDDNPWLPFANAQDFYNVIDATEAGDIPWQAFAITYDGEVPDNPLNWMSTPYEVWYCNLLLVMESQIGNHNFGNKMDYAPKQVFSQTWMWQFCDPMLGDWAWEQVHIIVKDSEAHGAMFAPVILGSDKTTVSVATVVGFLAIPKTHILLPLKPFMTKPQVMRCGDGHFRCIIYGVGPYIADYPEQALLACVVLGWCPKCTSNHTNLDNDPSSVLQMHAHTDVLRKAYSDNIRGLWNGYGVPFTTHFSRADIHELLAPNLMHQIIKVTWVMDYVAAEHGTKDTNQILDDID